MPRERRWIPSSRQSQEAELETDFVPRKGTRSSRRFYSLLVPTQQGQSNCRPRGSRTVAVSDPHPQDTPRRPTEGTCGFRAGERKALHASAREGSAASEEPGTLHARRAALLRTAAPPPCSPRQRGPGRGPVRKGPGAPSRSEEKLPPGADQRQRLPRGLRCRRCSPRPGRCSL